MTRITDEAVEAALDVLFDHGHNGIKCYDPQSGLDATVHAALEAALPHLEGATPTCSGCSVDPECSEVDEADCDFADFTLALTSDRNVQKERKPREYHGMTNTASDEGCILEATLKGDQ